MGNDTPPHLSPNLQMKMSKRKLRSEMGLFNTVQEHCRLLGAGEQLQLGRVRVFGRGPRM